MAINLFNKYGSRANPPSIDYPQGSVKNRSAPDVKDGTPLDADWANDHQGFFQSLLAEAGMTANGTPDKVGDSQYLDALKSVTQFQESGMVVFNTPGVYTWEVPEVLRSGKKKARVLVVGGGGGGVVSAEGGGANGGAGGGWAEGLLDLNGVASVLVTVAAGGASRTDSASPGSTGASSSFGSYLSATGGSGARRVSEFGPLSLGSGGIGFISPSAVAGVAGSGFVGLSSTVAGLGGASYFGGQTGGSFSAADNTVAGAGGPSGTTRGGKGGDGLVCIYW